MFTEIEKNLILQEERVIVFHEEIFQLHVAMSFWDNY